MLAKFSRQFLEVNVDYNRMKMANRNRQMAANLQRRGMSGMGAAPSSGSAQDLSQKFDRGILSAFSPGNIGAINNVIWPFFFTFQPLEIAPGQSLIQSFSVTQEAGFIWRSHSAQVFKKTNTDWTYIDPFGTDESTNSPNGLVFALQDAQSTRQFNGRTLQDISTLGNANFPTILPSTLFLLPNQTMQITLSNNNATETYLAYVTVSGYRIRVADAQKMLSTVSG